MPQASLILKNANVLTMDDRQPTAEIVAVSGDKIAWVGDGDFEGARGKKTEIIDCRGKTVVPGFIDAHLHFFSLVRKLLSVDLGAARSIADIQEAIRRRAAVTPPGAWISGADFSDFYLAEKRCPTRTDLNEAAPQNPVVISHRSL